MPILTYQFVYFGASGSHTRQPRDTSSYGGFTPIPGLNFPGTVTLQPGTPFSVQPNIIQPSLVIAGVAYNFAFMSVTGCDGGGQTSSVWNMPPPPANVNMAPVNVLAVYLPEGTGPGGVAGAVIDAFNESTGCLADNNFVTVSPDSGSTLTNSGNLFGWVPTGASAETISALMPHMQPYMGMPNSADFDKWTILNPNTDPATYSISNNALTVNRGKTVYAFAFYKDPLPKMTKEVFKEVKEHYLENVKLVFEKGGKELVEYTNPIDYVSDPAAYVKQIQTLVERLQGLESQVKGRSFIKAADRPAVGKTVASKTAKTVAAKAKTGKR